MTIERALHIMRLPAGSNPAKVINKAFKERVFKYHPDKTIADRKEVAAAKANKYKKIHKAFKVLKEGADVNDTSDYNTGDDDDRMAQTGGNNTIKRRHKKHKLAKKTRGKTRGKKHSNRRSKTRGKTYRKTRKNTTKRR
jgi:DnaJ-class molecular chaperone